MKKLAANAFQCEYCFKVLKTEKGIENHEDNCVHNTVKTQKQSEYNNTLEDIRTTSKSIHEVITRLQELWLTRGVKVTFNAYPNMFNMCVSNSHNSPRGYDQNWHGNSHLPNGYPGWQGNWKGTVTVVDTKLAGAKKLYFSDLLGRWSDSGFSKIDWIKTGTGSGGDSFNYDGMLFIYDFPTMYEEFKLNGSEFDQVNVEYTEAISTYRSEFMKERNRYKSDHKEYIKINELLNIANLLATEISHAQQRTVDYIHNEFNEKYSVEFVPPETIFVNDMQVMAAQCDADTYVGLVHPELKKLVQRIDKLSKSISTYKSKNPEIFI